jgi:hypothetical protein
MVEKKAHENYTNAQQANGLQAQEQSSLCNGSLSL